MQTRSTFCKNNANGPKIKANYKTIAHKYWCYKILKFYANYTKLDGLLGFARISKRKINQEFKKYVTSLGFEPATSCVAIGYSSYLAINQKEKLIKN